MTTEPKETPAKVATHATQSSAVDNRTLSLLGLFGPANNLSALVRLPGGRVRRVERGSRIPGGRIVGIDEKGLLLESGGTTSRVEMPGS